MMGTDQVKRLHRLHSVHLLHGVEEEDSLARTVSIGHPCRAASQLPIVVLDCQSAISLHTVIVKTRDHQKF